MRFDFLFLGKTKKSYLAEGIEDFRLRLQHFAQVEVKILKEIKPGRKTDRQIKEEEAAILLSHLPESGINLVLDPGGKQLSSEKLSDQLQKWEERGTRRISVIIGGPLGLSESILAKADQVLSLSKMTFTHEMARMVIMEQLYRAYQIRANTGYHK
ncbi:MAG: 23S rRNA (pseudouridine(1915)-N(3))-methyltransferase RlmH [Proteobacteria bacterium]|nr:23S rRNA (pseudouridine(1915)-N(3))-methyltransferase RlmH [Pseudomonadota bacterium]MBU1686442.1 23S rRNA (pseudouridine(1915)-N(3))-methyltransferase RlmH [Pseudomonadota bacterium]